MHRNKEILVYVSSRNVYFIYQHMYIVLFLSLSFQLIFMKRGGHTLMNVDNYGQTNYKIEQQPN
jgi:hypothetical protein